MKAKRYFKVMIKETRQLEILVEAPPGATRDSVYDCLEDLDLQIGDSCLDSNMGTLVPVGDEPFGEISKTKALVRKPRLQKPDLALRRQDPEDDESPLEVKL